MTTRNASLNTLPDGRLFGELSKPQLALLVVCIAHVSAYAWCVPADVLISDDYAIFVRGQDFSIHARELARPLYAFAFYAMSDFVLSSPNAVFILKGLSLLASTAVVGVHAYVFARIADSALAGIVMGILLSAQPGSQIAAVWMTTLPIWLSQLVAISCFGWIALTSGKTLNGQLAQAIAVAILLAVTMLTYQMPLFHMVGFSIAYLILTTDERDAIRSVAFRAATAVGGAGVLYGAWVLTGLSAGWVQQGRASRVLDADALWANLGALHPSYAFHWLNTLFNSQFSALLALAFLIAGALCLLSSGNARLLKRWGLAIALLLVLLVVPHLISGSNAAPRLYTPAAVGVSALIISAAGAVYALLRTNRPKTAAALALAGAVMLALTVVGANIATVIGIGLPQHAELQYVRAQIAKHDLATVKAVYIIPPDEGPFWQQRNTGPREDLYIVTMSAYHFWARVGIVRFALRYVDPDHKIDVKWGRDPPAEAEGVAIIDLRPMDAALTKIPY